ncbi:MAG: hypothetical protein Q8S54_09190 [Bacteroidota bacterium]|nr:hypothetical protein [Bacteroidota bacterium]
MKPIRNFALLMCAISLVSCLKNPDDIICAGDAMIVSKMAGNNVVYGLSIYTYTNSSFQSVQVVSSADAGKSFSLKSDQGLKTNFIYEMPESEYTATRPAASTYTFTAALTDGTTQVFNDVLSDKVLPIPTIQKCTYNTEMYQLDIAWPVTEGASSYVVFIFNGLSPVFASYELAGTTKSFAVISGGNGWARSFSPETGKTYTVRLYAYLYEDQGNSNNIQAMSFTDQTVVWGK